MRFFDAHCDTILKIVEDGADFLDGSLPPSDAIHVTLPGLRAGGVCAQVFACWTLEERDPGRTRRRALELVRAVCGLCEAHPGELALADSPRVLAEACGLASAGSGAGASLAPGCAATNGGPAAAPANGGPAATSATGAPTSNPPAVAPPIAAIVALEGADPLEGDAEALREFYGLGVRLLTLAWADNPFCGAVFGESGAGLSRKGEDLVQLCEELGVMVDVSHATDAAFWGVCRVATRPFVASHSDCRAVSAARRNLTDEMICALAERGGVMGINLEPGFLNEEFRVLEDAATAGFKESVRSGVRTFDEAGEESSRAIRALPRVPLDAVVAQVRHAVNVGGEDCVGLGGDLDGIDSTPQGIDSVADYPRIVELLLANGLSESQVEKVCWRNFARAFGDIMG